MPRQLYNNAATRVAGASRTLSSSAPDPNAYERFNANLMSFLMQAQANPQLGTAKFQEAASLGREAMARESYAPLSPELQEAGFSPSQLQSIRGARAGTHEPQARIAGEMGRTFGEQIQSTMGGIRDVLEQSRLTTERIQKEKRQTQQDALSFIDQQFDMFGSKAFVDASPEELVQLEKTAGVPSGYLSSRRSTLAEQGLELKRLEFLQEQAEEAAPEPLTASIDYAQKFIEMRKQLHRGEAMGKGETYDELLSVRDYQDAYKMWQRKVAGEGSLDDFVRLFPIEQYLGSWESPKLPASFRKAAEMEMEPGALPVAGQIIEKASGKPAKMTVEERDKFTKYENFLTNLIPRSAELVERVETGGIAGRYLEMAQTIPVLQDRLTDDQISLVQIINDMNNQLVYLLSGKQINATEMQRLKKAMPNMNLSNQQNRIRIQNFDKEIRNIYQNHLNRAGWTVSGGSITQQEAPTDNDPLGIR